MSSGKGTDESTFVRAREPLRWARFGMASLVVLTFALLVSSLSIQRSKHEASEIYNRLLDSKEVLPLKEFNAEFLECEHRDGTEICTSLRSGLTLGFPNVQAISNAVSSLPRAPTHVILTRSLSPAERTWVSAQGAFSIAALRNVHVETLLGKKTLGQGVRPVAIGNGATTFLTANKHTLENSNGNVVLTLTIEGLPWFGPGEFPFLLVSENATAAVQNLGFAQGASAALGRQLQLAIPFVIAVVALFLDHAAVFRPLAVLAGLRALRAFFGLVMETPWGEEIHASFPNLMQGLLGGLNGLMAAAFFLFALSMANTPQNVWKRLRWLLLALPAAFTVYGTLSPRAWLTGDTIADAFGAGGAGLILALATVRVARAQNHESAHENASSKPSSNLSISEMRRSRIERLAAVGSLATGAVVFLVLAAANAQDFLDSTSAKAIIDWRYALFYPGLLLVAFSSVGASSKVIEIVSSDLVRKHLLEAELDTAKRQMLLMQGRKKGTEAGVTWRVWQRQCVSVGGDFFDVRKLTFEGGELVVAVVLDVTGHGIQAAMIARSLSDAWATWCADATQGRRQSDGSNSSCRPFPATREERENLLAHAPARLLSHLSAARVPGSCTAVFALFDEKSSEVTLCNAGHPSPMFVGPTSHKTLTPSGFHPMINAGTVEAQWTPVTHVLTNEDLFLFSDGLFSEEVGVRAGSFAKRFRLPGASRTALHDPLTLWKLFRTTQRFYRAHHPADEDDITLVSFRFRSEKTTQRDTTNQNENSDILLRRATA
ncbi:MAG: serine/threonine-protein phosphatase [Silvanigrellales bacterium]|nr:serine/threonine-protein phosphatase [Silvanigrellales bacterium]